MLLPDHEKKEKYYVFTYKILLLLIKEANLSSFHSRKKVLYRALREIAVEIFFFQQRSIRDFPFPIRHMVYVIKKSVKKVELTRKPSKCPICKSNDIKTFLYGMPAEDCDFSKYIIGGCRAPIDPPTWFCCSCSTEFYRKNTQYLAIRADDRQQQFVQKLLKQY